VHQHQSDARSGVCEWQWAMAGLVLEAMGGVGEGGSSGPNV